MSNHITPQQAQALLTNARSARKPPVAVFGSGLLQACDIGETGDWASLIEQVIGELGLPFRGSLAERFPTIYWESQLARAARRQKKKASEFEADMQRYVAGLVKTAVDGCTRRSPISLDNARHLKAIVTLNFTGFPFVSTDERPEGTVPFPHFKVGQRSLWCIHGERHQPRTIRLGVRKYSQLATDLEKWRCEHAALRHTKRPRRKLPASDRHLEFIADVLEHPLVFAGCGLRDAEWTLWWLLATKARHVARHNACPSIFITTRAPGSESVETLLRDELLGELNCKVVAVNRHEQVWQVAGKLLGVRQARHRGTPR